MIDSGMDYITHFLISGYYPHGPQTNVALTTITEGGWKLCYSSGYNLILRILLI